MALVLADRVRETSTTVSTGTLTLSGAVANFQSFSVIGNSNTTYYTIVNRSASEWEVGIGTYTSSGTTLSRDTVLSSSNSGSLVNFSAGTKDVWGDYPAGKAVTTDTLAYPPAIGGTAAAAGTFTTLITTGQTSLGGVTGSEGLRVNAVAGSTNWLDVTGSSANRVDVTALGPASSNVALRLSSRGSQPVNFYTVAQTVLQFSVASTASAVNYVQVTGRATGNGPQISAQGSDAAINLEFLSKVNGAVKFFTGTSEQFRVPFTTGTIVNYATATGAIAGAGPIFSVAGTDADIDLNLTPKGAGRVNITTSIKPKVNSTTSVVSPLAWNSTSYDEYALTALANALTISSDANTAPADGQRMMFRFKDNGTAQTLTWTTGSARAFRVVGVTLPTTTVANKLLYVGCIYNAADSRWDAIAVGQET